MLQRLRRWRAVDPPRRSRYTPRGFDAAAAAAWALNHRAAERFDEFVAAALHARVRAAGVWRGDGGRAGGVRGGFGIGRRRPSPIRAAPPAVGVLSSVRSVTPPACGG